MSALILFSGNPRFSNATLRGSTAAAREGHRPLLDSGKTLSGRAAPPTNWTFLSWRGRQARWLPRPIAITDQGYPRRDCPGES